MKKNTSLRKKIINKFMLIDEVFRIHLIQQTMISFALPIIGIIISILSKRWDPFLFLGFCSICIVIIIIYRFLKCIDGDVGIYEGVCTNVYAVKKKNKLKLERDFFELTTEDNYIIRIYGRNVKKIDIGNDICVYAPFTNLVRKTEDFYVLNSYYYYYVRKNKS